MSTSSVQVNVMLAVHQKRTNSVDLYKPLRLYITQRYSDREAVDNDDDLQTVQHMRSEIEKASDSLEARRDLLQRYYRALCMIESRFPISNEKEHVNNLSFTWFDAFKQGKKATQQNIHFERAAIIFSLGAVQSQIALGADRSSPNGIKQACNCFQAAAGAFAFLRDNISMKVAGSSSTVDISVESAAMLERLMLAQAQECFFEKAIADQKPPSLCSKIAVQVGLYYEEAHAALVLPPLNQHFDRSWAAHVQTKSAQFHGEANYRIALELHEKEDIAEEIARLKVASDALSAAKKSAKNVVSPLLDAISKLEANVNLNLDRAIKENDRVYLMRIPPAKSLGQLPAASLVRSSNLGDVLDASKEKMFAGLVPDSSAKALSRYTEMLDDMIRTQAEKLQQESEITRVRLKEMELPESLHALDGSAALPEQLRVDVEAIQLDGGPSGLEAELGQLRDLKRVNQELLVQTEELLQKESQEDAQFRAQFGTRWTRPSSSTMTKSLQDCINNYAMKLKQAADMDARVERSLKDNCAMMSILDVKPIEAAVPTLSRPILSLNGDEDMIVGALKRSLGQLEMLGSQRAGLEDMLKEMKRKDNILPKLMSTSGSIEDLFRKELTKYDPVCQEVSKNVEAQEKLLQQIKVQNDKFAAVFNLEDFKASRDRVFKQLNAAVSKYQEIQDNISNAGIKFYVSLQDAINNLKKQCSEYAMTRNMQCRNMIDDLQRQLAGFSIQDSNPSMRYPPVSQSQRETPSNVTPNPHQNFYATGASQSTDSQRASPSNISPNPHLNSYVTGMPQSTELQRATPSNTPHHSFYATGAPQSTDPRSYMPPPPHYPPNLGGHRMPPPPYYSSHGQNQGASPYYTHRGPPPSMTNTNYSQPPHPGWRGPYHSNTPMNAYSDSPQYSPYQAPPGGTYYPPPQRDYHQ